MRKIVIIIFLSSLLSILLAIANGCKTTKHIKRSSTTTDSTATRVIDSTVTRELEHVAKDLLEHSEIKNDQSEKTIVTTTEEFTPDPKTGEPKLQRRTTKTEKKKNNKKTTSSTKTDNSIVDITRDSARKKDSGSATVHKSTSNTTRDVKKKTPFGLYAIAILVLLAGAYYVYNRYLKK